MYASSHRHGSFDILTLAGMEQPGANHWLTHWEAERGNCSRIPLGVWDRPHRNSWITAISHAVNGAERPIILVARGLACLAVAWWAAFEKPEHGNPVAGAMLVAPPNVDTAGADLRLIGFGPSPKTLLPFPSAVVASRNDPRMDFAGAQALARFWGSHCFDGGEIGSASAAADLGAWNDGKAMLDWVIQEALPDSIGEAREGAATPRILSAPRVLHAHDISL